MDKLRQQPHVLQCNSVESGMIFVYIANIPSTAKVILYPHQKTIEEGNTVDEYEREEQDLHSAMQGYNDHMDLTNNSPCTCCDHREELYCKFYMVELIEDSGYIFPATECDDDTYE